MVNGNGWIKYLIGVAILVTGAVIIGSGTTTIANTVGQKVLEVQVSTNTGEIKEQKDAVSKIPVMAVQISEIKEDVGKILDKLDK